MNNIVKMIIEITALIDDKEAYLVVIITISQIIAANIDIIGLSAKITPKVVATPLPPLNFRNKDQL
ncbi:MAG: hypothetical protein MUP69_05505 [Candidatus Atribacteria bacterium]|nr:hypothetical protein [Candidatus Atribacteria bacterium]